MDLLEAGGSQKKEVRVTIPQVSPGEYLVVVFSDRLEEIDESNEENNIDFSTISIEEPETGGFVEKPDLIVTRLVIPLPPSAKVGETIEVIFRVENQGGSPSGPFSNRVYLDDLRGNQYSLGSFSMASLEADSHQEKTVTVTIPNVSPGYYEFNVLCDELNEVDEFDEEYNHYRININIEEGPAPPVEGLQTYEAFYNGQVSIRHTYYINESGWMVYHGMYRHWYENGQLREEKWYVDGKLDGVFSTWHESGWKMKEITYKDGLRDGPYREYFSDFCAKEFKDQIYREGEYENDRKCGVWKIYCTRFPGQVQVEENWKDDLQVGSLNSWHCSDDERVNGKPAMIRQLNDKGEACGTWIYYPPAYYLTGDEKYIEETLHPDCE